MRLGHSIMLYATLDIELCRPLNIRGGFLSQAFFGRCSHAHPQQTSEFFFFFFHNLAWSYCGEFLGWNIWKEKKFKLCENFSMVWASVLDRAAQNFLLSWADCKNPCSRQPEARKSHHKHGIALCAWHLNVTHCDFSMLDSYLSRLGRWTTLVDPDV